MKSFSRLTAVLLLMALLLSFSGCSLSSAEELYCLPDASEEYNNLQKALTAVTDSGFSYLSPASGAHQEPAELVDLDGDGTDEAVVFFSGSDSSVITCVFAETDGAYQEALRLSCAGTGINSVEYRDLNGDGTLELLLCCSVGESAPQILQVYSCVSEQPMLETVCAKYLLTDLSGGSGTDLICFHDGSNAAEAALFRDNGTKMEARGTVKLSGKMAELSQVSAGRLSDGTRALIADFTDGTTAGTNVLLTRDGSLTEVVPESGRLELPVLQGTVLYPQEQDADGCTEFPVLVHLPAYGNGGSAEYAVCWEKMDQNGSMEVSSTVCYSISDGWCMTVPDCWSAEICLQRSSTVEADCIISKVVFYRSSGDGQPGEEQLTVYTITGENRQQYAEDQSLTVLYSGTDSAIAVRLNDQAEPWDGSLSISQISENLKLLSDDEA